MDSTNEDKLAAFIDRYAPDHAFTADQLRLVPPCAICGALPRIEAGRLTIVCDQVKHSKALQEEERQRKLELVRNSPQVAMDLPTPAKAVGGSQRNRDWWNN